MTHDHRVRTIDLKELTVSSEPDISSGPIQHPRFPSFSISLTGPQPSESARTKAVFSISGRSTGGWNATLKANNNNNLTIVVASPANAPIGWYTMNVEISSQGRVSSQKLGMFILLFNPWLQGRSLITASPPPATALIEAMSVENKDD